MKLGIMQPYFFPYIGYFQLMNLVDEWVIFDTPQYIRKGWVNRNRVLKKNGGVKYIGISVEKCPRETPINMVRVNSNNWVNEIYNNLDYYKTVNAPFYEATLQFLYQLFEVKEEKLASLLKNFLIQTCSFLKIPLKFHVYSEMKLSIGKVENAGDWALEISKAMGAKEYINPPGGVEIFNRKGFENEGIDLKFIQPNLIAYDQKSIEFVPGLSIIDVMMFNSVDDIQKMLNQYELV